MTFFGMFGMADLISRERDGPFYVSQLRVLTFVMNLEDFPYES